MKQIITAIKNVMQDVAYIEKGKENKFHNYRYAGEGDVLEKLRPALIKHGLVAIPELSGPVEHDAQGNTHIVMKFHLHHESGESLTAVIPASGNDRDSKGNVGDKGVYKAITGATKYFLFKTFLLETGDDPELENERNSEKLAPQKTAVSTHKTATEVTGAREFKSKYSGTCRNCGDDYAVGDPIYYIKGEGSTHVECGPPAVDPVMPDEPAFMEDEIPL